MWWRIGLVVLSFLSFVQACNVPVFRYGLERWPADPHMLTFNRSFADLPPQAEQLRKVLNESWHHANLVVEGDMIESNDDEPLKASIIYADGQGIWWEGEVDNSTLDKLTNSPMRRDMADKLLTGTTAVWVFYEGVSKEENAQKLAMLKKRLKELEKILELPIKEDEELDWGGGGNQRGRRTSDVPLKIAFDIVVLKRDDAEEEILRAQFDGFDPTFAKTGGAMAVAVFGRGRALPIYGEDLNEEVIDEASAFLCGACSCQVKDLNPGVDILMSAAWDEALESYPEKPDLALPDLKGKDGIRLIKASAVKE